MRLAAFLALAPAALWAVERDAAFEPVAGVPGAFQLDPKLCPLRVGGRPLNAAEVMAAAGKPDGYSFLSDGVSLFSMEYAHRAGRREPLRPMAADLSDWAKAPACPPDRVLIDPRTGRLRFFPGHDPASFQSRVLARFRGTHGDNAIPIWRGNTLFLSHWESSFHLWAYDATDPSAPRKVGEVPVANFTHGFALLDSGYALMGTTSPKGVFLVDVRDPARMRVVRDSLVPRRKPNEGTDWLRLVTPRYVAVWGGNAGWKDPRLFDAAGLPDRLAEVTASVPAQVLRYLAGRLGRVRAGTRAWFHDGQGSLGLLDFQGEPSAWRVLREIQLDRKVREIEPLGEEKPPEGGTPRDEQFAVWSDQPPQLQVLDARNTAVRWGEAASIPAATRSLNVRGHFAYLAQIPPRVNEAAVTTWDGMHFAIYDLSAAPPRRAGEWAPAQPNRAMSLHPHPDHPDLVLVLEPGQGTGFYLCSFDDPLKPAVLSKVTTNGEGNRVAVWGGRAVFTSSTLAMWLGLSPNGIPQPQGTWFNHRWFRVLYLFDATAVLNDEIVDIRDPRSARVAGKVGARAAWGSLAYGVSGGRNNGPVRITITDIADPWHPKALGEAEFPERTCPPIAGAWADGSWLYAISESPKEGATLMIFDVADPAKVQLTSSFQHPELVVRRNDGFWTAQGRVITAARGIVLLTSYTSGAPRVIDARNPKDPKLVLALPVKVGSQGVPKGEWVDSQPDGPWFYIKSYPDPLQLWDFTDPEHPRKLWEEVVEGDYDQYGWQAGVPTGEVLLTPRLPYLKAMTVPRPPQTPTGRPEWRATN